jgi:hypothetical protein
VEEHTPLAVLVHDDEKPEPQLVLAAELQLLAEV